MKIILLVSLVIFSACQFDAITYNNLVFLSDNLTDTETSIVSGFIDGVTVFSHISQDKCKLIEINELKLDTLYIIKYLKTRRNRENYDAIVKLFARQPDFDDVPEKCKEVASQVGFVYDRIKKFWESERTKRYINRAINQDDYIKGRISFATDYEEIKEYELAGKIFGELYLEFLLIGLRNFD
jgi:pantoate kinase